MDRATSPLGTRSVVATHSSPVRGRAGVELRAADRGGTRRVPSRWRCPTSWPRLEAGRLGEDRRRGDAAGWWTAPDDDEDRLVTVGRVPGLDQAAFNEHALAAKADWPVSKALEGGLEIMLDETLAS